MNNNKLYSIIRIVYTLFMSLLVPIYWYRYGPTNFLWFCNITMFIVLIALWAKSNLLISMVALGFVPFTLIWNVAFFFRLISGNGTMRFANYMFDSTIPLYMRGISLFHMWLPCLLIWLLYYWGYNRRALFYSSFATLIVLSVSYMVSPKHMDINYVFGLNGVQTTLHPLLYLAYYMLNIITFIHWPLHCIFKRLFHSTQPAVLLQK